MGFGGSDGVIDGVKIVPLRQIVDERGKVRASISIMPATKLQDGSTYPETVLLRLITPDGRPSVKLSPKPINKSCFRGNLCA